MSDEPKASPEACFDPWWKRFHGRNGYHCDEHCDHGIPRGEKRTCKPVATQGDLVLE